MALRYLATDTETGGLTEDSSLLTAYFAVLDEQFNIIDELDLKLIPDNRVYTVSPAALEINKINLIELGKNAVTYKEAKSILYKFLQWNYLEDKYILIGQSVQFDVDFIIEYLISENSWGQFVGRRVLDTMLIARFLQLNGILPVASVSLGNLIEYFDIKVDGVQHEARYDTLATVEVYKKLVELIKK